MGEGVAMRIGRFPAQTPLGTLPGLGIQPRHEFLGELWVKIVENTVINIRLVWLSPREWPKVGQPNRSLKKSKFYFVVCVLVMIMLCCHQKKMS